MISSLVAMFIYFMSIVLTVLFVVGTHEYAHFLTARCLNIKVLRFSIGFGKTLLRWQGKTGTEYVFALIPLGGYVKMLDETEGTVSPEELPFAFNRQPLYKKFMVVAAGPLMNIGCAFLLYWLILMIGFTAIKPVIGNIYPQSIAAQSGLIPNQEILSVDDERTPVWTGIVMRLLTHIGNQDTVRMEVKDLTSNQITTHELHLKDWHLNELNPDPLLSLGIVPYAPPIPLVIGIIAPSSPAASSALQIGDKIIAVNKKIIKDWPELISIISKNAEQTLRFKIERQGQPLDIPVKIGYQRTLLLKKGGYLGISPVFQFPKAMQQKIQFGPLDATVHAWNEIVDFTYFNVLLFAKLFSGKLSLQSLGGPITIFESAGVAMSYGLVSFLGFLAFLSISIGIINFLPIPGLDGGHLFFYLIESLIRRPLPLRFLQLLYRLGFIAIMLLLIQAVLNDLLRLH